ncbi:MAG: hypothetical protein Kow0075_10870 [Salibacteraceae bacterium]
MKFGEHKIEVNADGWVILTFGREIQLHDLEPMLNVCSDYLRKSREKNNAALMMVDVASLEKVSLRSRQHGFRWMGKKEFDKLAVLATTIFMKHFVNMLIVAAGLNREMKVFSNSEDLKNWLNE